MRDILCTYPHHSPIKLAGRIRRLSTSRLTSCICVGGCGCTLQVLATVTSGFMFAEDKGSTPLQVH